MVQQAETADIVILGGALSAMATAWHVLRAGFDGRLIIVERDAQWQHAATALSAGGYRTQFSTAVNVALSLRNHALLMQGKSLFGDDFNVSMHENGYLLLASPAGLDRLMANNAVQKAAGANTLVLDPVQLAHRFEWLAIDGLAGGGFGLSAEGWFDPMALLGTLRKAVRADDRVVMLSGNVQPLCATGGLIGTVSLSDGRMIRADHVVNATGAASCDLTSALDCPMPVEPRKRTVFHFRAPDHFHDMPLLVEPGGVYVRPEGEGYICGLSPPPEKDRRADPDDFEPDWPVFEEHIWPVLAARIPAFERLRLISAWAGHYDYNRFDQNALIGRDPFIENLFHITGFSGHGVQQALAASEWLSAQIMAVDPAKSAVDCSALSPVRVAQNKPFVELGVI